MGELGVLFLWLLPLIIIYSNEMQLNADIICRTINKGIVITDINRKPIYVKTIIKIIEDYNRLAFTKGLPLMTIPSFGTIDSMSINIVSRAINSYYKALMEIRLMGDSEKGDEKGPPLRYGVYDGTINGATVIMNSWTYYPVEFIGGQWQLSLRVNDNDIAGVPEDLPYNYITDSNGNTAIVSLFNRTFDGQTSLESADLSNWNVSKVTAMNYTFSGCSLLSSIDLSNWDTSNVTNMSSMFSDCTSLASITISSSAANLIAQFPISSGKDITEWSVEGTPLTNTNWNENWGDKPVTFTRTITQSS